MNRLRRDSTATTTALKKVAQPVPTENLDRLPLELLQVFLKHVALHHHTEALDLCQQLLTMDPNNATLLEYQVLLKEKLADDDDEEDEESENSDSSHSETEMSDSELDDSDSDSKDEELDVHRTQEPLIPSLGSGQQKQLATSPRDKTKNAPGPTSSNAKIGQTATRRSVTAPRASLIKMEART